MDQQYREGNLRPSVSVEYAIRLEKIEAELNRLLPETPGAAWQEEVFPGMSLRNVTHLLPALTAPGRDLLSRGGKRWRPLLMTLVCEALGGGDAALPLAPLVEFCHNASLIHDDIEDNSDERRGKPAVHIIHGVDTAINGGCFLYFLAAACIDSWATGLGPSAGTKMYSLWADYMRRLHLGQSIDIYWHRNADIFPPLEEYFSMCALKTGCLARFAAEAGIVAALNREWGVGSGEWGEKLFTVPAAAEKLGVGFQILDDVKNLTVGVPGKKRGDDIAEGKKSLPVLLFVHRRPEMRGTVCRCFNAARAGAGAGETEELIQALAAEGVLAEAEDQGKALIAQAREVFAENGGGAEGTLLAGLTDLLI